MVHLAAVENKVVHLAAVENKVVHLAAVQNKGGHTLLHNLTVTGNYSDDFSKSSLIKKPDS